MKISALRRALLLANIFNLLVALYFIIIAIIALIQLRWYHQLTITVKVRYLLTSMTSYFSFFILIVAGLLLIAIFVTGSLRIKPAKVFVGPSGEDAIADTSVINTTQTTTTTANEHSVRHESAQKRQTDSSSGEQQLTSSARQKKRQPLDIVGPNKRARRGEGGNSSPSSGKFRSYHKRITLVRSDTNDFDDVSNYDADQTNTSVCCSIMIHLITTTCLVVILIIWLFNTGELVRDSISSQLEAAYNKYQFTNRSNHNTIAIDGMQDINNCCGSLDYKDFPHHLRSGLTNGHYPGSCCGKNVFGVNARVACIPEEIVRAKQTTGCTIVLANYYDLISILIVPVALVSLFVNIVIIALITILKGSASGSHNISGSHYNEHHDTSEGLEHLAALNYNNQRTILKRGQSTRRSSGPHATTNNRGKHMPTTTEATTTTLVNNDADGDKIEMKPLKE